MAEFFKTVLRGLIYTLLLPFILLIWGGYGVYCLLGFTFMFIKAVILFFKGDSISGEMKEDVEARRIVLEKEQAQAEQQAQQQEMTNAMYQTAMAQAQMTTMMMQAQMMNQGLQKPTFNEIPETPITPIEEAPLAEIPEQGEVTELTETNSFVEEPKESLNFEDNNDDGDSY